MQAADLTVDLHSAIDGCDIGSFTYILPDHSDGTYELRKRVGLGFGSPYTYRVDKISASDLSKQPLSIRNMAAGYPARHSRSGGAHRRKRRVAARVL